MSDAMATLIAVPDVNRQPEIKMAAINRKYCRLERDIREISAAKLVKVQLQWMLIVTVYPL